MSAGKNTRPASLRSGRLKTGAPPNVMVRAFGRLKVRQKLAILHNIFFSVLAISVYLSLIPLFSQHLEDTQQREFQLYSQMFVSGLGLPPSAQAEGTQLCRLRQGSAEELGLNDATLRKIGSAPGSIWKAAPDRIYRLTARPGVYQELSLSSAFYDSALRRARASLFIVLGTVYLLSIVVLEFIIMPQYVYQPLTLMLEADAATQADDREHEMIDARYIMRDEIGQIMSSRNATVAQLRRQEDDLAHALRKLEEQDRLVSLGLLSTSVAHELNTPLAVLQGSIEKLMETSSDAPTQERLARMLRVTQRLRKISEGLVDFARVRKSETEIVELRPVIDESWSLVAIDEKASAVQFRNNLSDDDAVVGNADRLIQVFVNLLRNALIAVETGGEISIESKQIWKNGQKWLRCSVLDNGPGIPEHLLGTVFEAFVSSRLDARGTGLGLTVAEGIVSQHGGTITAANRPAGGAALEVLLPAL